MKRASLLLLLLAAPAFAGERTLSWTLPATTAKVDDSGRIVSCEGGHALTTLAGWRLFAQIQSPTWVRRGTAMKASPSLWADSIATVFAEALPRQVRSASSKHLPNGGAGMRMSTTAPDSIDGQPVVVWFVVTFNDSGKASCPSNWAAR